MTDPLRPVANAMRMATANILSDLVMSVIGLGITGAAVLRWATGETVEAEHASLVGVIVAYFFGRNHLTALNAMMARQTATETTAEIQDAMKGRTPDGTV